MAESCGDDGPKWPKLVRGRKEGARGGRESESGGREGGRAGGGNRGEGVKSLAAGNLKLVPKTMRRENNSNLAGRCSSSTAVTMIWCF